jgi:hypothetical protein
MAVNRLPQGTEVQPTIPAGTYPGRIIKSETRTLKFTTKKGSDEEVEFIDIGALIQTPDTIEGSGKTQIVSTSPFNDHTRTSTQSGSKAVKFLKQLGFKDPVGEGYDLDSLINADVVVTVKFQMGKDGVPRNWISDIARS